MVYFRRLGGDADALLETVLKEIRAGRVGEALSLCRAAATPFGRVASESLECFLARPADTEETMQVTLSQQKMLMERNTGLLGTMAAVAPLIGLLGTVWGIMRAFHDMAATGSAAPSIVAAGVAEALLTTAAGLVIAVPAVLLFNHFNRRLTVTLTVAENHTRTLRVALAAETERGGTPVAPPVAASSRAQAPVEPSAAGREPVASVTG
jgi:biopolymer transport protein ExbB